MIDSPLDGFRLDGKVAIVTGASGGLGARFAKVLNAVGARLVLAGRRVEPMQELAAACTDAVVVPCDMKNDADIERLVTRTLEQFGAVDVVVNNAGTVQAVKAFDESMADVRDMLEVDLVGLYRLSQLAAASMRDRGNGGSIINIASYVAHVGTGRLPMGGYTAAKGGVLALTRELAAQWGRYDIRVNAISPGFMDAGMGAWARDDPKGTDWIRTQTPLRRQGREEDLDGALLYLAGSASSFMTGQSLIVDGGWTAI